MGYWPWFFLAQRFDFPETLIGWNPGGYFDRLNSPVFTPEARAEYRRCFLNPDVVHAICEDYRAGVTIDCELDEADRGNRKIACPVLALWGTRGAVQGGSTCWQSGGTGRTT